MLSFSEFTGLLAIARQHSQYNKFVFAAGKYIDDPQYRTLDIVWRMKYAHLNVRHIRSVAGLTQADFAEKYGVSKRSVESWEGERRRPPEYLISLLAYAVYADRLMENSWMAEENKRGNENETHR